MKLSDTTTITIENVAAFQRLVFFRQMAESVGVLPFEKTFGHLQDVSLAYIANLLITEHNKTGACDGNQSTNLPRAAQARNQLR